MVHQHSPEKQIQRQATRLILATAYQDRIVSESVCTLSRAQVFDKLPGIVDRSLVPNVEHGEILVNSRGEGTFQR
jgi:hypothetical protein